MIHQNGPAELDIGPIEMLLSSFICYSLSPSMPAGIEAFLYDCCKCLAGIKHFAQIFEGGP